jgi:phosphomannomutase/phosphoglucomutase
MNETSVPRLFGTDGIRKVVGTELTPAFIVKVADAVAHYLRGEGPVLVARDFRTTSPGFAQLIIGTLSVHGLDVIDMGVMPTPCLQFNVRTLRARMGLTVTASHNPTDFNGIKFTGPDGLEISREEEDRIERLVDDPPADPIGWETARTGSQDSQGVARYLESIQRNVDRPSIMSRKLRVVLDPGNGTSGVTSPLLLRDLAGTITTIHGEPDGFFRGRPSEPTEANLSDLKQAVVSLGADVGIAHDGDSDRAAFVDEKGQFLPGEITLALFARHALEGSPGGTVVTSVTSSTSVKDVVEAAQGRFVVTRSGSLPVARAIMDHRAIFGGEENGGYYWPNHQVARDGPMSSAKMLEVLARTGRPLSELVASLPHYTVVKLNVPLPANLRSRVMDHVLAELQARGTEVVTIDGVKALFSDGWLLVRPSGTEPLCRIFAESRAPARAQELVTFGRTMVEAAQSEALRDRRSAST